MVRLLLLAGLLVSGLACGRRVDVPPSMAEPGGARPAHESWDVRFSVYQSPLGDHGSRPRLELQAGYMAVYEQGDTTYTVLRATSDTTAAPVEGRVTAALFDPAGAPSAVVRADRILYFDRDRRFEAHGRVVVETTAGKRLESDVLYWHESERKVRTPGFTRLTTPTEQIQGYGFVADENLDAYSLSRVSGKVLIEDE